MYVINILVKLLNIYVCSHVIMVKASDNYYGQSTYVTLTCKTSDTFSKEINKMYIQFLNRT